MRQKRSAVGTEYASTSDTATPCWPDTMVQLHVSKSLTTDLKSHLADVSADLRAMQWYGHRVQVMRRKCVILMEARSRYAMLFAGLTKPDFARFPELIRDRLRREAVAICRLDDERSAQLAALVDLIAQPIQIMPGSDRSVQAHINDVVWHLEWMAGEIGALPANDGDAFGFGMRMNQMLRKCKGERDFFSPLAAMREFWLGLLAHAAPRPDNVVPFRRPS